MHYTHMRSLLLIAACLLAGTAFAERIFFEAESMAFEGKSWKVVEHFPGWYDGVPSGGKMLWGAENSDPGTVRKAGTIKTAGTYNLWVRHLDSPYRGPFKVTLVQGGKTAGEYVCDARPMRETLEGKAKWGDGYAQFVWEKMTAELQAGPLEVQLTKAGAYGSWISRYVDCICLSDDPNYEPKVNDFLPPLFIKIKMGPTQKEPCAIHLWGMRPMAPWYLENQNIYKDKMDATCYTGYDPKGKNERFLTANTESPWIDVSPMLTTMQKNKLQLYAMQDYPKPLSAADFTVLVSRTKDEKGVFKRFTRTGSGGGMLLWIDQSKVEEIQSDRELSQGPANFAAKLPPVPGKRPSLYPVMTGCAVNSDFYQPATVNNEIKVLSALGIDSIGLLDPAFLKAGFSKGLGWGGYFQYAREGCLNNPDIPSIKSILQPAAKEQAAKGLDRETLAWMMMDEPGSMDLDHIVKCPYCGKAFVAYLKQLAVPPGAINVATLDDAKPVKDPKTDPKLYYYTACFRNQALADFFRIGTDAMKEIIPGVRTTANFSEDLTYNGNGLSFGVDWFLILRNSALTYGWCEDWMNASVSCQLSGYRADFMRSACGFGTTDFGMYTVIKEAWDTAAKAVNSIGHGNKVIDYYNYGPEYASIDAHSTRFEIYPALREADYAIGAVEGFLQKAKVPRSKIALVYSPTTDIWTLSEGCSNFGKDRAGLYLILKHLGYPIDILTEQDLATGAAAGYQALFYTGSHLQGDGLAALLEWVQNGGRLICDAGSLQYDQFNQPLGFDRLAGLARKAYEDREHVSLDNSMQTLKTQEAIDFQGKPLEAVCALQKLDAAPGATTLATFADRSPAVTLQPLGKGSIAYCAFLPGISYMKSGMVEKTAYWAQMAKAKQRALSYNPPAYAEGYRALFAALLQEVPYKPRVTVSNCLVEANVLEGEKGLVVTLANWAGKRLQSVKIAIALDRRMKAPVTATCKPKAVQMSPGRVTLTMDLGAADFIVLPY